MRRANPSEPLVQARAKYELAINLKATKAAASTIGSDR
jgi:hypothetical protein